MPSGKLLVLVLVATSFEMSPAFTSAPAHRTLSIQGRIGPLCLFGKPAAGSDQHVPPPSLSKTRRVEAAGPARQPGDPMTYGQRIYPVHPSDLTPEDRRNGLAKLVMFVGVRDCIVGLLVAGAFFIAGAGHESPDFQVPVVSWLLSCIMVGRVFQDGLAPAYFNFDHQARGGDTKTVTPGVLHRSDSFAQWRESAISPPGLSDRDAGLPRADSYKSHDDKQRLVVEYAQAATPDVKDRPLRVFKQALGTIVWGFVSDVVEAFKWVVAPKSNSEPNPDDPRDSSDFEVWDPRDAATPHEPGV